MRQFIVALSKYHTAQARAFENDERFQEFLVKQAAGITTSLEECGVALENLYVPVAAIEKEFGTMYVECRDLWEPRDWPAEVIDLVKGIRRCGVLWHRWDNITWEALAQWRKLVDALAAACDVNLQGDRDAWIYGLHKEDGLNPEQILACLKAVYLDRKWGLVGKGRIANIITEQHEKRSPKKRGRGRPRKSR
jgi:hypothetical protein